VGYGYWRVLDMKKADFYWNHESKTWWILVAADHEYSFNGSEWWKGKAKVVEKGFDYSNRYGWFVKMGVSVLDYVQRYPEKTHKVNQMLSQLEGLV
tara:strand:- start:352 stop:639 length:288 start_codon:yes stop_codon:yes gene_type:complete